MAARAALALAKKKAGLRYTLDVVPLDGSWVRGSHGRLPDDPRDGLVVLCSDPASSRSQLHARDLGALLLELGGVPVE